MKKNSSSPGEHADGVASGEMAPASRQCYSEECFKKEVKACFHVHIANCLFISCV